MKLTASERKILDALWAAPDKVLQSHELNRAAGLTITGGSLVRRRMVSKLLIGRTYDQPGKTPFSITVKGMRAIGVTLSPEAPEDPTPVYKLPSGQISFQYIPQFEYTRELKPCWQDYHMIGYTLEDGEAYLKRMLAQHKLNPNRHRTGRYRLIRRDIMVAERRLGEVFSA
jgi:hypothetical protein